jgi:hypothetical protein
VIGTKLYPKKSRFYFLLIMYGVLAIAGGILVYRSISQKQNLPGAAGFMVIFGAGMFFLTLAKMMRPQVSVFQDFLELKQTRATQLVRFRNITGVSRPDKNRLVITLREDNTKKEMTIWLKDLAEPDVLQLEDFLRNKGWKT